jgi:CDP-diacylglycerol--glycerol-3-phosphate 3-phosphatidyltransferase
MKDYESLKNGALDRFWTIPNMLTIARIILLIPIIRLLRDGTPESFLIVFILIIVGYLTDMFDGLIARMTNQVSKVGMILDPVSDKLVAVTLSAALHILELLPFYFFLLIVIREIIISLGGLYAITNRKAITLPSVWGKLHTLVFGIVISFYPLNYSSLALTDYEVLKNSVNAIVVYGTYVSIALIVISTVTYILRFIKNFIITRKEETTDK